MNETTRAGECKRRRSEGDAATASGDEELQNTRHVSGVTSGASAVANGHRQHTNGREAIEEKHEDDDAISSSVVNEHRVHGGGDEETKQQDECAPNGDSNHMIKLAGDDADSDDDEEEEDDVLVVLELADFKNHPIFDDYRSIRIEGIDTASPVLQIGEYTLYGQLEETVGTNFFYDTTNRTRANKYQYVGQTTKKIKFTIAPPEP